MEKLIEGPVYVVADNIDTDQIIPAQYLSLVPTIQEEYEKLGTYALSGLPYNEYPIRYVEPGQLDSKYPIIIAGRNFGCGSSREHAPIALGSAGCKVVVAESFARIFFRNCIATGQIYPCECKIRLCQIFKTGEIAQIDLDNYTIRRISTNEQWPLIPMGDLREVIEAGGIFAYARKKGMILQV